jgi:translation initiation factor 2-alpha kinase 4
VPLFFILTTLKKKIRNLWNAKHSKKSVFIADILTATHRHFQRVAEGLSEDDAWRLFHQIVEALVYMSNLGIVSYFFFPYVQILI